MYPNLSPPINPTALPEALKSRFSERGQPIFVPKGQIVVSEGEVEDCVYWIQRGTVQFSLISVHGREVILRDIGANAIFGESAAISGLPRSVTATAIVDSTLFRMSSKEFKATLHELSEVSVWLANSLAARVSDLTAKVFELATLPIAARVQLELLKMAEMAGIKQDRSLLRSLPTHTEFAAKIGTHREAITRELNVLTKEGIIQKMPQSLQIVSVKRLRESYDRFAK